MLRGTEAQRNFFDDAIFARMIPPDHPLVAIDQAVDFSFIHEGRPSHPPETVFRALYLGIWANLSDVAKGFQEVASPGPGALPGLAGGGLPSGDDLLRPGYEEAQPMEAGGHLPDRLRGKGNPRGDGLRPDSKTKL